MSDDELARLRRILDVTWTSEGVDIWLEAPNRHLGGRIPLDLIAESRMTEVITAAERIERSR